MDKARKQLKKNLNEADAGLKKKGHGVVKSKGNMTLDKAGGEIENFGNDIANGFFPSIANKTRAFFDGGCTRNEYIGVLAALGILIAAVLIGGLAAACPYLEKSFGKAGGEFKEGGR